MNNKYHKKISGFSLVEGIVTAVIMGILAAVAIPMYAGYITDARQTTVNNLAETAAAAANATFRRTGALTANGDVQPNTAPLNLYFDGSKYTVAIGTDSITVTEDGKGITARKAFK